MTALQNNSMSPAVSWLFLGYFLVLFAERAHSLVRICRTSFADLYRTGFDGFVDTVTVLSMTAALFLLIFACKGFWQSLFNPAALPDYTMLTVTAGVMLVSGMMHTEYTVAPVQFVSYGMLIVAMILRTVQVSAGSVHVLVFACFPDGVFHGNSRDVPFGNLPRHAFPCDRGRRGTGIGCLFYMDAAGSVCRAGKRPSALDSDADCRSRRRRYSGNALEGKRQYLCPDFHRSVGCAVCGGQGAVCIAEVTRPVTANPALRNRKGVYPCDIMTLQ